MKLVSGMQGTRNQETVWGDKKWKEKKERKEKMNIRAERGTR